MKAEERLIKARISLQAKSPFFSYLSLYLKFKETKNLPDGFTAGIDIKGNVFYNPEFINKLTEEECMGVICHELLHMVLAHLQRTGTKDRMICNIADDIVSNELLKSNKFKLPKDCIWSDDEHIVELKEGDKVFATIEKADTKTTEYIYDELIKQLGKKKFGHGQGQRNVSISFGKGKGKEQGRYGGFDIHFEGNFTDKEKREISKEWLDRTQQALCVAKMRGNVPFGIERQVGDLSKSKINWKTLLYNQITKTFPYDFSYHLPSKRSISVGTYLPSVLKEKVEVVVCLDLSGSIGDEEMKEFMSEVIGIARAFQERVSISVYSHDTEGYPCGVVANGNIEKLKKIELKGCGGTSHEKVMDMIKEKEKNCKSVVFFTDGYSDLQSLDFNKYPYEKIFVISENGSDEQLKGKRCQIINLKEN